MSKTELPVFSIRQLLEAGAHFGHKTMRRNPKMSRYIYTSRNGVSIIDLNQTANLLNNSLKTVKEVAKNNGRILFVATKKQASDVVAEAAKRCGQYYVNFRWLGGMLTNWKTVSQSIKTLKNIEEKLANTEIGYNKKEKLVLERQRLKLEQSLGGIKNMGGYPDLVFVIDTHKESIAVSEAKKLHIPIMAILDSNCNPDGISFPIPGNDDSAKTIKLFCRLISDAAIAGIKENMVLAGVDLEKLGNDEATSIAEFKSSAIEKSEKNLTEKYKKDSIKPPIKKTKSGKEIIRKSPEEKEQFNKSEGSKEKNAQSKKLKTANSAKKPNLEKLVAKK